MDKYKYGGKNLSNITCKLKIIVISNTVPILRNKNRNENGYFSLKSIVHTALFRLHLPLKYAIVEQIDQINRILRL